MVDILRRLTAAAFAEGRLAQFHGSGPPAREWNAFCGFLSLRQFRTVRHLLIRHSQDDGSVFAVEACDEELGAEGADLLRWEVHDAEDLAAEQFVFCVERGDLGAGLFDADPGAEVRPNLERRFAGFWEIVDGDNGAHSQLDAFEV